ncbi:MAG: hypothetical protein D6706_02835, partial [Chloroflexi bacterium]
MITGVMLLAGFQQASAQCNPTLNGTPDGGTLNICVSDVTGTVYNIAPDVPPIGASTEGTFTHNVPGATMTGVNVLTVASGTPAGSYTVTYTVTSDPGGTCNAGESTTITFNIEPQATLAPNATNFSMCVGSNADAITDASVSSANGSSAPTFTISNFNAGGTGATLVGTTITNPTSTGTITYDVVENNACGTSPATTVTVTVNANPTVSASSNSPICEGATLNLGATPGGGAAPYTYSWSGPNGFTSTSQNPSITGATLAAAGTYSVTVTDANGCTATASTTVTVNANPKPSITATETSGTTNDDGIICAGDMVTLDAGAGYIAYNWSTGDMTQTINVMPGATTTYTVTVTDANGCSGSGSFTVTVNNPPSASITGTSDVCLAEMLTVDGNPTGGSGTYTTHVWTQTAGTGSVAITNNNDGTAVLTATSPGTVTITYSVTDDNGCSVSTSASFTVHSLPTAGPISGPSEVCDGSAITLNGQPAGGSGVYTTHNWAIVGGTGSATFVNNNDGTATFTGTSPGTVQVAYSVVDNNSCSSSTVFYTFTVNANPTVTAGSNSPICEGDDLNLTATPSGGAGGYTYSWSGPNGFSSMAQNPTIVAATTAATGTYSVTVTDANGCTGTASTTVTVNANPTPTISVSETSGNANDDGIICAGDMVTLDAGAYSAYSWSTGATTQTITE